MEKKYFLLKLIPPRITFPFDMNDEEKKIMGEHADYWKELMDDGYVVVYGPVFDPGGAWGMGVIEADNEEHVKNLLANDPTIKSGLNKLEIFPMKAIIRN